MKRSALIPAFLWLISLGAIAEEMILRGTSIKAMEGLPTITFVVPWQPLQSAEYITMPKNSVLNESLNLVDYAMLPTIHNDKAAIAPSLESNK